MIETTNFLSALAHPEARLLRSQHSRHGAGSDSGLLGAGLVGLLHALLFWGAIAAVASAASSAHALQVVNGVQAAPSAASGPESPPVPAVVEEPIDEALGSVGDAVGGVSIPSGDLRRQPLFVGSQSVSIDGSVPDAFAFTGPLTVNGEVRDNLVAFSGSVDVPVGGRVGGDVFAFTGTVHVAGDVEGDLYAWSGDVRVARGAKVHGNVLAWTGDVAIDGDVGGDVKAVAGNVRVDGSVGGDLDLQAGRVELGPNARVAGKLDYVSQSDALLAPGAVVGGAVTKTLPKDPQVVIDAGGFDDSEEEDSMAWSVGFSIFGFVASLLVGWLLLLVGGSAALKPSSVLLDRPGQSLGLGFVGAIGIPLVALVAMIGIVTIPASILVLVGWFVALLVGELVTGLALGGVLSRSLWRGAETSKYWALALGLAVLVVASLVPYLGFLAECVSVLIGFGALLIAPFTKLSPPSAAPPVLPAPAVA